jgi:hypothetical protein
VADLRSKGLYDDADCRKGTMLASLMLSVKGSRVNTVGSRLSSIMDLALEACAHDYVRAGGRSRSKYPRCVAMCRRCLIDLVRLTCD